MNAEKDLLKAYQSEDDDQLMQWLMQESAIKQEAKPPKASEAPKVEPVKPVGFFNTMGQGVGGALTSAGGAVRGALGGEVPAPGAPMSDQQGPMGPDTPEQRGKPGVGPSIGRAFGSFLESAGEGFTEASTPGEEGPGLLELPGGASVPVPESLMRFPRRAIGAAQALFSWAKIPAGLAGDAMEAASAASNTDAVIDERIRQLEALPESTRETSNAGQLAFLRRWRMMPYDERQRVENESMAFAVEILSGVTPGYTLAARGGKALLTAPAKAASEAAIAARANVIKAAGESISIREAEKATRKAEAAAKPVEEGGPRGPLTLADLRHGMQPESTPGVKAGPSAPGSIPENMMTLEKLNAQQKLAMLRAEPGVQQAIDEVIPDPRTMARPGVGRTAEAADSREALRASGRTPIGGDLPSSGAPARRAVGDDQLEEIARATNEGGASFSLDEGRLRLSDEGGYYVGGQAGTVQIKGRQVTAADIADFAKANEAELAKPGAHIGAEKLPDGTVNLDVSVRLDDEASAFGMGRALKQERIWDASGNKALDVPPETSVTGHPYTSPSEPLDDQAIKMAQEYDAAVTDPAAKPAWDALARETDRMFDEIAKKVKVERVTGQPYATADEMLEDIKRGNFKVTTDNSEHPFWSVDENWKFRVVHDYLGHFDGKVDFSLKGEKDAYLHHAKHLTDPAAKDALQLEVYGQAAANVAHGGVFQPQKAYITKQPFGEIKDPSITAYHGTASQFDSYKTGAETRDGGTWFSADPETAGARAMGEAGEIAGDAPQVRPVVLRMQNIATEEEFRAARILMQGDTPMASELLKSKGYDGVVFNRPEIGPTPNYLVFDANKSANPLYGSVGQPLETALQAAERRMAERLAAIKSTLTGEAGAVDLRGSFAEGWEKNKMLWNDLVTIGAGRLWEMQSVMANKYQQWSAKMLAAYGDLIKPQLPRIFEQSQKRFDDILAKVERKMGKELPALSQVLELYHRGEAGLSWYDEAWPQIQRLFGKHAELYVDVLSATSPNTGVKSNVTKANEAMALILSGKRSLKKPFKATITDDAGNVVKKGDGLQAHTDNLNRILKGQPLSGPKVGPFSRALKNDRDAVVVDTWMKRAFGFDDAAKDGDITFIQQAVTGMAEALGKDARQVQAAIWTGAKIVAEGPGTFVEDIHKTIGRALMDAESPLHKMFGQELALAQKKLGEEGFTRLGTIVVAARTALFAAVGAATGDDAESRARNMLIAAGLGLVASPKLAKQIVDRMNDPEVRTMLKDLMKDETGALFPKPKRKPLVVNQGNTGGSNEARALIRGVNRALEKARMLERSRVVSHEETILAASLSGKFRTVEDVLALDHTAMTLNELAAAKVNVKAVRDVVTTDIIETAARAKMLDDEGLMSEAVDKTFLLAKVNQKWADMETAGGRFVEASKIKSPASLASKYDLDEFAGDIQQMRDALLARGKVTDRQLVEMLTEFADKAAALKVADVASRWPEALWNIYYGLNLLGSPITHARNTLGNIGGLGMAVTDRAFGEIIALPFHAAGKGQNMVQPGETWELATGIYTMVANSFRAGKDTKGAFGYAKDAFKSGESLFGVGKETEGLRVVEAAINNGQGTLPKVIEVMSHLGRANLRFMGGTDEFFKVISFSAELHATARRTARANGLRGAELTAEVNRLVDSPTSEMLQHAEYFARENTFTKAFAEDTLGGIIEKGAQHPFMRVAFTPFYRTPMRLAEFSTTHTPILNLLAKQTWSDMFGKNATAVTRNLAAAKIMTGTAALGLVGWFALNGYITGNAPSDPSLRAAYERSGWKEKSIYNPINGKYYSYDNLEPLSTIVSTAANMVQISRDLEDWDVQTLMMAGAIATSKSVLSKQWFQGLSDFADVIEAATRGEDVARGLVFVHKRLASLIPGAAPARLFNKMTDDQRRELKTVTENDNPELREWSQLVHIWTQNIPGWGHLIPGTRPRPAMVHMITGEPIANENTWLQAINPFQVTTHRNDPVLNELVALEGAGLPREIPRVVGGQQPGSEFRLSANDEARIIKEGVKLNEEERQRLGVLLTKEVTDYNGDTLHEALTALIETDEYDDAKDGRDGGKAGMIQDVFNTFMEQAQNQLFEEYPELQHIVLKRQLERGLGRIPKSQDDLADFAREQLESQR